MFPRRIHSTKTLRIPTPKDADLAHGTIGPGKPPGFWYGFEDSWIQWCKAEHFHTDHLKHHYEVVVDNSRILHLTTEEQVRQLAVKYPSRDALLQSLHLDVEWTAVADEYDGIEIVPYQWNCRLTTDTSWYYGWDCASGCIWRVSAIKSIQRVLDVKKLDDDEA